MGRFSARSEPRRNSPGLRVVRTRNPRSRAQVRHGPKVYNCQLHVDGELAFVELDRDDQARIARASGPAKHRLCMFHANMHVTPDLLTC